jgi:hypothetical protein
MLGTKATSTILLIVISTLAMTMGATASQINAYHDTNCDNYAYTLYSSDWECQAIAGIECVLLATLSATCNFYYDISCTEYIQQEYLSEEEKWNTLGTSIFGSGEANSIACAS